jgi:hypothetical protein
LSRRRRGNENFWEDLIAYFPLYDMDPQKSTKLGGHTQTQRQQGDLIWLIMKIRRDAQTAR